MTQNNDTRLVPLFIGGLFAIALMMIAVIYVATRRPVVVVVPGLDGGANGPPIPSAVNEAGAATVAAAPLPTISLNRVESIPSLDNPLDPAWEQIAVLDIPLEMQQTAEPMLTQNTVPKVQLQTVYNSERFVWRLSWEQAEPSYKSNVAEFSDAVAIQFPLKEGAPYTMGGPDMPVAMMYWKALWQKDIDEGFQDVTDVYPNSWYDLYWFANDTGPVSVSTAFENKDACPYMAGSAVGNPMSTVHRKQPVQELRAHGFGSSTDVPDSPVTARGAWRDGRWYVVFERPNSDVDPLIKRFFENPEQQMLALAVWDGQAQNRGGRKHITNWIPMRVEK
jgi:hypothetical protein